MTPLYIRPGKPVQSADVERFNRGYRTEVMNVQRDIIAMGGKPLPLLPDPKGGNGYGRGWDAWLKEEQRLVK